MSDTKNNTNEIKNEQKPLRKRKLHPLRILVLVVVFCAVVFGTIVVSDLFFSKDDPTSQEPEIVAVTVSGESIILNDEKVTFERLREYLDTMEKSGDLFAVALINDTENPADYLVYNRIVDLLREYEIICEKMEKPASYDEINPSTQDET